MISKFTLFPLHSSVIALSCLGEDGIPVNSWLNTFWVQSVALERLIEASCSWEAHHGMLENFEPLTDSLKIIWAPLMSRALTGAVEMEEAGAQHGQC